MSYDLSNFLFILPLLSIGCAEPSTKLDQDSVEDTSTTPVEDAPPLILMITMDAFNRDFLGRNMESWNTTPVIDSLTEDGTLFENVQTVRSFTSVALGSMLSGAWPKHTGIRTSHDESTGLLPLLQERFREAGWTTIGLSGNQCQFIEEGFDHSLCTEFDGRTGIADQAMGDEVLAAEFIKALADAPQDKPVFAWVHFMDPHDPYIATRHLSEFYPYTYTGGFMPGSYSLLEEMILKGETPSAGDLEYFRAVYASQVRGVDDQVGVLVDALKDAGRYEDATIAVGMDHGEELYEHNAYPYHGCSPYQDVMATSWLFRAPERVPAGQVLQGWASIIDVAPTLMELGGLEWTGLSDGASLVPNMREGLEPDKTVYFERDIRMAGMIRGDHKFFLTTESSYDECEPYVAAGTGSYLTPNEALFDLAADPGEQRNLASDQDATYFEMYDERP